MVRGAGLPALHVVNGQTRTAALLEVGRVLGAAGDRALPGEGVLRAEPFASRRFRARTASRQAKYCELRRRAEERERSGRDEDRLLVSGERRARDWAAREAVRLRSGGRCESPECLLPDLPYRTAAGRPLLEIDHIDNHAGGGRDHPSSMIALCPNCHANKTRGADGDLRERLRAAATALDTAFARGA
ncbi:HNH endonuclease [Streptomyces sp. STCH 565 A]|uniref:HNH endonuclease n=1 Tax=Streptomyces sp. STCH 565 A TaxID=2950532 RepID=UPI0035B33226